MIKRILPLLCMLLVSLGSFAQQRITVKGTVVDAAGQPIIGATVLEKGTLNGTTTNLDGQFEFKISSPDATVEIRYTGYATLEFLANSPLLAANIVLQETAQNIEQVVVIGYGSVRKKDMTGSVVALKSDLKDLGQATNASDMLIGKVPGVQITPGDGAPGNTGTIRIRGGASLTASNNPLVVVDGVPLESGGLGVVNPNDIASMTILKDASATAIYGSRGSNGVIIIQTKKGTGKFRLSYYSTYMASMNTKTVQTMGADEYRQFMKEYYPASTSIGAEAQSLLGKSSTSWQDQVFQLGLGTNQYISGAGKVSTMGYRVSLGYDNQNGTLRTSNFERFTGSVGLNPKFFDEHLTIDVNAKITYTNNKAADGGAVGAAAFFDPTQDIWMRDASGAIDYSKFNGYYTWTNSAGLPNTLASINPVAILDQRYDRSYTMRSIGNAQIDYKFHFLPELRANLNVGYDVNMGNGSSGVLVGSPQAWRDGSFPERGGYSRYDYRNSNNLLDFYLNYAKEFEKIRSRIDVMAGYSWQHFYQSSNNSSFSNDPQPGDELKLAAPVHFATENYLVSFFGRINYTFADKYMLTATLRNDGSSRFSPDTRWGLFPSVAFAWDIAQENFLKSNNDISQLKFRLGYGITGQQDLGLDDYPYISRYNISDQYSMYQFGDKFYKALKPEAYDANIKWEETTTYNVGFDWGVWNNRLFGSVDLYYKETKDLLNRIPIPAGANFSNTIITNIGNLNNRGIEVSVNIVPVETRDWNLTIGLNGTWNRTEIQKLTANDNPSYLGVTIGNIQGATGTTLQLHSVGYAPYTFYTFQQVYGQDGKPLQNTFVDRNGDGVITDADRYRNRKPAPDAYFGLTAQLSYKNWYFAFNARANVGNYMFNDYAGANSSAYSAYGGQGFTTNVDRTIYRTGFTGVNTVSQRLSDYWLEDASFIKMDNVTLGYDFANLFGSNIGGRLSFTAQNLFTITGYSGLDPEGWGIDNANWPRPRTFVFGLALNF